MVEKLPLMLLRLYLTFGLNRHKHTAKRNMIQVRKDASIASSIAPSFCDTSIKIPHCLLRLSATEWRRCKDNSINVTRLFKSDITSNDNVVMSSNIKAPSKKTTTQGIPFSGRKLICQRLRGVCVLSSLLQQMI